MGASETAAPAPEVGGATRKLLRQRLEELGEEVEDEAEDKKEQP